MKTLRTLLSLLTVSTIAITLSACSPGIEFPFDDPKVKFDSPNNYGYGLTGDELPDYVTNEMDNINVDDSFMLTACQHMEAFETGTVRNFSGDVPLTKEESKDDFRSMVLDFLEYLNTDYPETTAYYSGALAHLTDSEKTIENYESFKKACLPYLALVTRSAAEYMPAISMDPPSCWRSGDPANIRIALERKVGDSWVEVTTTSMSSSDSCESDYPYSGDAIEYSPYDYTSTFRWHYTLKDGGTFDSGDYDAYDDEFEVARDDANY